MDTYTRTSIVDSELINYYKCVQTGILVYLHESLHSLQHKKI